MQHSVCLTHFFFFIFSFNSKNWVRMPTHKRTLHEFYFKIRHKYYTYSRSSKYRKPDVWFSIRFFFFVIFVCSFSLFDDIFRCCLSVGSIFWMTKYSAVSVKGIKVNVERQRQRLTKEKKKKSIVWLYECLT